jgi:hypothetical protein
MKHIKRTIFSIVAVVPSIVMAETLPEYNLTIQSIFAIINGLVCWMARISYVLMVIMLVFYGIMYFFSEGEMGKIVKAKDGVKWAAVGILVTLGAYTIIATIANAVGVPDVSKFLPLSC